LVVTVAAYEWSSYGGGVYTDGTNACRTGHQVQAVGYTSDYFKIKNSWGSSWGENGCIRFARDTAGCGPFGIFTKGGEEIFRAQTIAGYAAILTGMRKGSNGYTIEINTRFPDHWGGNKEMIANVLSNKIAPSGFTKRKILDTVDNYEDAVVAFSTTPYASTEYNIVSGVKKGIIIARNPEGVAYTMPLDKSEKKYIIMTNFDYNWGDIRERFDPTGGDGIFHPRRKAAEAILDNADSMTPELLWTVINDFEVMAKDTIFQVIMDVETGLWNASLPACTKCGWNATQPAVVV